MYYLTNPVKNSCKINGNNKLYEKEAKAILG